MSHVLDSIEFRAPTGTTARISALAFAHAVGFKALAARALLAGLELLEAEAPKTALREPRPKTLFIPSAGERLRDTPDRRRLEAFGPRRRR